MSAHKMREIISPLEKTARSEDFCRGCNGPKEARAEGGPIVCWTCWRRPDNPFKYFQGTLEEWLEAIKPIQP